MESLENFSSISALYFTNEYVANCSALHLDRSSCQMSQIEGAKRSLISFFRLVFALLSVLGTFSILVSVMRRKQVFNPKVHSIFMLSIADFLLGVMWVVGGMLWMAGGVRYTNHGREGCFTVNIITVILELVTINLTSVYALLAYSSIKRKDFTNVYSLFDKDQESHPWKPWKIILAYVASWVLPVFFIMIPFSVVAGGYNLVREASNCSCWCLPYFGNVVPMANPSDNETAKFLHHMSMFVGSYAVIVTLHYLVGFVLLVIVYWKILRLVKMVQKNYAKLQTGSNKAYGVTSNVIAKGQSRARQRVVYFLTAFVICGFFNLLLSIFFVLYESFLLREPPIARPDVIIPTPILILYLCQSITVPFQGFLNAIVYGWTREDFLQAVRSSTVNAENADDRLFREQSSLSSAATHLLGSTNSSEPTHREGTTSRSYGASRDYLFSIPEHLET